MSNNFDSKGMEYVNQNGQFVPNIKDLPASSSGGHWVTINGNHVLLEN